MLDFGPGQILDEDGRLLGAQPRRCERECDDQDAHGQSAIEANPRHRMFPVWPSE